MRDYEDIVNLVEEENVKFIRLTFFDIFGEQKSLSIMPHELQRAFSEGVAFDGSSIAGFEDSMRSDLFLEPDPTTAILIPWRSMDGAAIRMFCDITRPDRSMYPRDSRYILKQAVKHAAEQGLEVHFGTEVEFYLFKRDEEGNPTRIPQDEAGYFDTTPKDGGENIRRDICNILLEMGIFPESSHHENGPGQHEVVFRYADPLSTADNTSTLKWVIQSVAAGSGCCADLSPKPLPGKAGSGMHFNISVDRIGSQAVRNGSDGGRPLNPGSDGGQPLNSGSDGGQPLNSGSDGGRPLNCSQEDEDVTNAFMAGIMRRINEITLFLNPSRGSYQRLGNNQAPGYVSWSQENRSQLIRIPAVRSSRRRFELRSPDPLTNPYLAFALVMEAGLEGVRDGLKLPEPVNVNLFTASPEVRQGLTRLPADFDEAVQYAKRSEFVRRLLPDGYLSAYSKR